MGGLLDPIRSLSMLAPLASASPFSYTPHRGEIAAWWPSISGDQGTTLPDLVGNVDLTLGTGMAYGASTEQGGSWHIQTDQAGRMSTAPLTFGGATEFSLSVWCRRKPVATTHNRGSILAEYSDRYVYMRSDIGNNEVICLVGTTEGNVWASATHVLTDGDFHHWVLTFSFPGAVRNYVNGAELANTPAAGPIMASTQPVWVGGASSSAVRYWDGDFDAVRFFDVELTPAEIAVIHAAGRAGPGAPPGEDVDLTAVAGSTQTSGQAPTLEVSAPIDLTVPAGATHSAGQAPTLQIGQNVDLVALAGTSQTVGQTPIVEAQKNIDLTAAVGTTDTSGQAPTLQIGANVEITAEAGQSISQGRIPQLIVGGNVQLTAQPGFTHSQGQTPILQIQENVDLVAIAGQSVTVGQIPSLIAGGGISMAAMAVSTQVIQAQIDA